MLLVQVWLKTWIYLGCVCGWSKGVRPQFDTSTDMGLVLVPADADVDSVIFRLRATDQDADFPLVFDVSAAVTPIVRIENLPCTLYNKVCQANVILTRRLIPGRLHDFAVRVRDSKGESNSMQATISVTNASTPRDTIFPHIPSLIMVPEDAKPGKELDYLLARASPWSGKPVYIELWQPKELFTIKQRQTPAQTRGIITLIGELDFETQSMYTLKMYATDPYTEPGKDTRNIAGLDVVVVVQDVQDVPPVFTLAPPLTRLNNSVQPGDVVLRVHAEDGDKGAPREVTYGLVSEGNPFTPFFNISETTGEIILTRPLEELTQITHVGAPVVLSVVAEEIRRSREEPPAQATVVELGLLLGEPGNSPPYFENDKYMAWMEENADPGTVVTFTEPYSTKVRDEDVGKAGVFALKLGNNNGTFEITPAVAERTANFIITVRDNALIDFETHKTLEFSIIAQEVGPATNLSASVPVTIFLRDVNDNPPEFEQEMYEVTLSENVTAGTRVIQVHATDKDTGLFGSIQYTRVLGSGSEALVIDPDTGIITVAMGSTWLDREAAPSLQLSVEARDEDGRGLRSTVPLIINILDVNDNDPIFQQDAYEFSLNSDLTNFTAPAIIKAVDADAEPPNNEVRYELVHGNYENKFHLDEITGELILLEPINKARRTRHSAYQHFAAKFKKGFIQVQNTFQKMMSPTDDPISMKSKLTINSKNRTRRQVEKIWKNRKKRADEDALYTLTARAYDLGVPHRSSVTQVRVISGAAAGARTVMFVVSGEHPDKMRTAKTLEAITGGRVTIQDIRPYTDQNQSNGTGSPGVLQPGGEGKKSIVVARVEQRGPGTSLVDIESIREILAESGVGIIGDMDVPKATTANIVSERNTITGVVVNGNAGGNTNTNTNVVNETFTSVHREEVTVYRAENKLLLWLLILLGLLVALAALASILCCICPGCPFYMAPRKRRVHSSETLVVHSDGRPKRHLHRKQTKATQAVWSGKKQAWSADPAKRNWQFNRRNTRNRGLASLPGDIAYIPSQEVPVPPLNITSLRLRDGPAPVYVRDPAIRHEEERIYIEDVEGQMCKGNDLTDVDSIRKHELERGSDIPRQSYMYVNHHPTDDTSKFRREQHFYRDGNAEVLRLVTRGHFDGEEMVRQTQRPTTLVIEQPHAYHPDGKDILLRRFIEDQKMRYNQNIRDSMQDIPIDSTESLQRPKESLMQQKEIILLPERLEREHRQHIEELTPDVQRLVIDHGEHDGNHNVDVEVSGARGGERHYENDMVLASGAPMIVSEEISKDAENQPGTSKDYATQPFNVTSFTVHEMELARQNVLLTQLLLERESRGVGGAMDSSSFLETQSLPGQVAIATQTDRTAATQTEQVRSRSDNDESEDDARLKKKMKLKKRHGDSDLRRSRSLWMRSPIQEEDRSFSGKRIGAPRRKAKESREGRRATLETEVLREISDSLDDYGSSPKGEEDQMAEMHRYTSDVTDREDKVQEAKNAIHDSIESSSSPDMIKDKYYKKVCVVREKEDTGQELHSIGSRDQQESPERQSFRVIERKITSLRKQANKLKINKFHENDESGSKTQDNIVIGVDEDGDVYNRSNVEKGSKKVSIDRNTSEKRIDKRTIESKLVSTLAPQKSISSEDMEKTREGGERSILKTRRMLKYQKGKKLSTESSEFEDVLENINHESSETERELSRKIQQSSTTSDPKVGLESKNKRTEHKKKSVPTQRNGNDKYNGDSTRVIPYLDKNKSKPKSSSTQPHSLEVIGKVPAGKPSKSSTSRTDGKKDNATGLQSSDDKNTESAVGKSLKAKVGRTILSQGRTLSKYHSHAKSTDESTSETPKSHSDREKLKKSISTQRHKFAKSRDNVSESLESDSRKSNKKERMLPDQRQSDDKEKKGSKGKSPEAKSEYTKSRVEGIPVQANLDKNVTTNAIQQSSKLHSDDSKHDSSARKDNHENRTENVTLKTMRKLPEAESDHTKSTEEGLPAQQNLDEGVTDNVTLNSSEVNSDKDSSPAGKDGNGKRKEDISEQPPASHSDNKNDAQNESVTAQQHYDEKSTGAPAQKQSQTKSELIEFANDSQSTQQLSNLDIVGVSAEKTNKPESDSVLHIENSGQMNSGQNITQNISQQSDIQPELLEPSILSKQRFEEEDINHASNDSSETNFDKIGNEEKRSPSQQYSKGKDAKIPAEKSLKTSAGHVDSLAENATTQRLLDAKSTGDLPQEKIKSRDDNPEQKQQKSVRSRLPFLDKLAQLDAGHSQLVDNTFPEREQREPFSAEVMRNFISNEINESLQNMQGSYPYVDETSSHRPIDQPQPGDVHDEGNLDGNILYTQMQTHETDESPIMQNEEENNSHDHGAQEKLSIKPNDVHQSENISLPPFSSEIVQQDRSNERTEHGDLLSGNASPKPQSANGLEPTTSESIERDHTTVSRNENDSIQTKPSVRLKNDDTQQDTDLSKRRESSDHVNANLSTDSSRDSQKEMIDAIHSDTPPTKNDDNDKGVGQSPSSTEFDVDNNSQRISEEKTVDDSFPKSESPSFYVLSDETSKGLVKSDEDSVQNRSSLTQMSSETVSSVTESHSGEQHSAEGKPSRSPENQFDMPSPKQSGNASVSKPTIHEKMVSPSFQVLEKQFSTDEITPDTDSNHSVISPIQIPSPTTHSLADFQPRELQNAEGDPNNSIENKYELSKPTSSDEIHNEEHSRLPIIAQAIETPAHSILQAIHTPHATKSSNDFLGDTMLSTQPYQTPRHQPRIKSPEKNIESKEIDDVNSLDGIFGSAQRLDEAPRIDTIEHTSSDGSSQPLSRKEQQPKGFRNPSYEEAMKSKIAEKEFGSDDKNVIKLKSGKRDVRSTRKLIDDSKRKRAGQETGSVTNLEKQDRSDNKQRKSTKPKSQERIPPSSSYAASTGQENEKQSSKDTETMETSGESSGKPELIHHNETRDASSKRVAESMKPKQKTVASTPTVHISQAQLRDSKSLHKPGEKEVEHTERKDIQKELIGAKKKEEHPEKPSQQPKVLVEPITEPSSSSSLSKSTTPPKTGGESAKLSPSGKGKSRYMAWYKQKRDEMDRKRQEKKESQEEEQRPRWMRKRWKLRTPEAMKGDKVKDSKTPEMTPRTKRKIKPLVNVESEQLRAIVRQGRKLRREGGGANEDPPIEIFAPEKPPTPPAAPGPRYHPLVQHSEYKYEKMPPPFYLHAPPGPHPTPQISPEHMQSHPSDGRRPDDDMDSGIAVSLQGGNRLRHQQLLEKKSVFDIAYNEAAPYQLRADSTTPPS